MMRGADESMSVPANRHMSHKKAKVPREQEFKYPHKNIWRSLPFMENKPRQKQGTKHGEQQAEKRETVPSNRHVKTRRRPEETNNNQESGFVTRSSSWDEVARALVDRDARGDRQ